MADFNVSTREVGPIKVIDLRGYLDAHTAPELEREFNKLIDSSEFKVVVNFNDLKYISSAGLGVFMGFIEDIREKGGDIKLAEMNDKVFRVFDLLGFPVLYEIYTRESEAIEKYNQSRS